MVARLEKLAKGGKLPGFIAKQAPWLFAVDAFGATFDYQLCAKGVSDGTKTRLEFSLVMLRKVPAIIIAAVLVSIWPGIPMTDSMLRSWFVESYGHLPVWVTYAWYLPLTVLPVPWMWVKWHRQSHAAAREHADSQINTIRTAIADAK